MGNWNTSSDYESEAYGVGVENAQPTGDGGISYVNQAGIPVTDYSVQHRGMANQTYGGDSSPVANPLDVNSGVTSAAYPGAASIPSAPRSYSDVRGLVNDALVANPEMIGPDLTGVAEQSSVTGIAGLASRARDVSRNIQPGGTSLFGNPSRSIGMQPIGPSIMSGLRSGLEAVNRGIDTLGGNVQFDLGGDRIGITYARPFNKGGEAVSQDYTFEPRVTDPRRPSEIPLAEREAYADLDKMAETGFRSYLGYKADREDYQQGLRNLIANDPMGPALQSRNEDAMLDFLDYMQFYAPDTDDVFPSDRLAREAAIYKGKVPYGFEDDAVLYGRRTPKGIAVVHGAHVQKGFEEPEIFYSGRNSLSPQTTYHEGYHDIAMPQYAPSYRIPGEEEGVRAIDYYRAIALGNQDMLKNTVENMGFDPTTPEGRLRVRENALAMMVGIPDEQYENFRPEDREAFIEEYASRITEPDTSGIMGSITRALQSVTGPDVEMPFEYMLNEAPQSEFIEFLKRAPAYRKAASMYNEPKPRDDVKAAVRGYENGGPVDGYPDTMFTQQPDREYGALLPLSRPVGEHPIYGELPREFDVAGGITGGFGRGLETFERQLSGDSVSDEELIAAGLDVIPVSAGVANAAAPAAAPGIVGMFMAKHASPRLIRERLKPTGEADPTMGTSVAGPGVYMSEQTDDILSYALKEADRKPVTEADEAFNVGRNVETKSETLELLANQAHNQMYDVANGKAYYFMKDGSLVVDDLKTGQIDRRGKGSGFIYNTLVDANKDEFFDFRKSLTDQSPKVRQALSSMKLQLNVSPSDKGETIYKRLRNELGGETAANNFLRERGLAGSVFNQRGKEMMVVFDPDKLDVKSVQPVSNVPAGKR